MKLMQNPWVVGCLALVALALVAVNVVWPILKRSRPTTPSPRVSAPATPVSQAPASAPSAGAIPNTSQETSPAPPSATPMKTSRIEDGVVRANVDRWMETPRRNPFHSLFQPKNRAKELLTLTAVWRQTGSTLAVINNKLVAEGDMILDFKVEKIREDRVWVVGPDGRQAVDFKLPVPTILNNSTNMFQKVDQESPNH